MSSNLKDTNEKKETCGNCGLSKPYRHGNGQRCEAGTRPRVVVSADYCKKWIPRILEKALSPAVNFMKNFDKIVDVVQPSIIRHGKEKIEMSLVEASDDNPAVGAGTCADNLAESMIKDPSTRELLNKLTSPHSAVKLCLLCNKFCGDYDYEDGGAFACGAGHFEDETLVPLGYEDAKTAARDLIVFMLKAQSCADFFLVKFF